MKYILFTFFLALLMSACSPEETSTGLSKNLTKSNNTGLTSLSTKTGDELYYQFKRYAEENPSFSRNSFIETNNMNGMPSIIWLEERRFSSGVDKERGILFANSGYHAENFLDSVVSCLNHAASLVGTTYSSQFESSFDNKIFGLRLIGKDSFQSMDAPATENFTSQLKVGIGEKSLIHTVTENDENITLDIKELGLSRMDLLKYIHLHEGVTMIAFKINNSEENKSYYDTILIFRLSGKSTRRYEHPRVKQAELNYEGAKLQSAIVWKPDGEKCSSSGVENGNGFLVKYNKDGTESYRSSYKDGDRVFD
jgi:hypothetical protein